MTDRRIELSGPHAGGTLVLDEAGTEDGPVVLWLHSEWGTYDDPPVDASVLDRARVITIHQPGWGLSTGEDHLLALTDVALLYWWAADQLELTEPMVVAGHGIGAVIAAEMAIQHPHRVSSLLLAAPFGIWDDTIGGEDFFALMPRDVAEFMYADTNGPVAASQFPPAKTAHEKGIAGIRRAQTLGPASRYLYPLPDTGVAERLYRLADTEVTLIWGAHDGLAPIALADRWTEYVPHARLVRVDDAAHMVVYECDDLSRELSAAVATSVTADSKGS